MSLNVQVTPAGLGDNGNPGGAAHRPPPNRRAPRSCPTAKE